VIASNKKARHDYAILKTYEAGLVLAGTEVKSLREGRASLVDAFAQEHEGEIMLYGLHIAEYGYGSWTNHTPRRTRKLLLHKSEILKILAQLRDGSTTQAEAAKISTKPTMSGPVGCSPRMTAVESTPITGALRIPSEAVIAGRLPTMRNQRK